MVMAVDDVEQPADYVVIADEVLNRSGDVTWRLAPLVTCKIELKTHDGGDVCTRE